MSGGPIRVIELRGGPSERGRVHGERLAGAIREYTDERVRLASNGSWAGRPATRDDVIALAEQMLPAHRAYSPDLYEEMRAMADAAGISLAEAVIVGGFTDFVDALRAITSDAPEEDDCTSVIVPPASGGPLFAQTWDMHDTATPHVVMLDVQPDAGPSALVFSTAGCVGQIGMNDQGICVGINNLTAADGKVGVTWPFVVREVLRRSTIEGALEAITSAELAGGHNFQILDAAGRGFNIEAMPTHTAVTPLEGAPLIHTNHCLDAACQAREAPRASALHDSSVDRLHAARAGVSGPLDTDKLIALLREPTAICRRSSPPYHVETSGAVLARPDALELWAVWGIPADHPFERFLVGRRAVQSG